jgi:membrane protein DedA with SNARE-associated domain
MTETFPWSVQEIAEWMPFWKGAGFFLATFVVEDAAAIGAGLSLAAGTISWPVAFTSCFLGIWLGDLGLYALARFGGRKWFEQSSFKRHSAKVAICEAWFAEHGTLALIFSRCVPGTRLPTYLASGFLRVPLLKFLAVTGSASFVWTWIVLWLAETAGARLVHWLGAFKHGTYWLFLFGAILLAAFQLLRHRVSTANLRLLAAKLQRWRHWEFWPAWLFYPPVVVYGIWLAIKHRGLMLPTAANPGIFAGGLVGESKMATLQTLAQNHPEFTASAGLIPAGTFEERITFLEEIRARLNLQFPFILKPDLGQRGNGVKLVQTQVQAEDYLRQTDAALLAQRYAPGPFEAGIFYYRFPQEPSGRIFGSTDKVFPVLIGNGSHTLAELLERDARARLLAGTYLKRLGNRRNEVPPAGESVRLVEAGNHAQGCIFRDGRRLWSAGLEARLDEISQKVGGFFIGRYDIRYGCETDLRAGKNFQIVELNGAGAEASNIYDARNSLWSAYRTLFQQWELVFAIGAENRRRGIQPTKLLLFLREWRKYWLLSATYPAAD